MDLYRNENRYARQFDNHEMLACLYVFLFFFQSLSFQFHWNLTLKEMINDEEKCFHLPVEGELEVRNSLTWKEKVSGKIHSQ